MTSEETVLAFADCINRHDVDGLGGLMTDDHVFIDAHGNEVAGKAKMLSGWRGYFEWFPDYYIEVIEVFAATTSQPNLENSATFAMTGFAGGSFKGKPEAGWRLPAAWKAVVRDKQIALWQVFADTKIPSESMK